MGRESVEPESQFLDHLYLLLSLDNRASQEDNNGEQKLTLQKLHDVEGQGLQYNLL